MHTLEGRTIALIMDSGVNGLGIAQSLGIEKDVIIVVLAHASGFAHKSKYVHTYFRFDNDEELRAVLFLLNKTCDKIVPYPGSDHNYKLLIELRAELQNFSILWDKEHVDLLSKEFQLSAAVDSNILVPKSVFVKSDADFSKLSGLQAPYIIKPSDVGDRSGNLFKAEITFDKNILKKWIRNCITNKRTAIISEYIPGGDENLLTFGGYAKGGVILASFTGRKIAQQPRYRGVATIAESCNVADVKSLGTKFVNRTNFSGLFQLEVKMSLINRELYFIEFNPRNWVWGRVATVSGINLPLIKFQSETGIWGEYDMGNKQSSKKVTYISLKGLMINLFRDKWPGVIMVVLREIAKSSKLIISTIRLSDLTPTMYVFAGNFIRVKNIIIRRFLKS